MKKKTTFVFILFLFSALINNTISQNIETRYLRPSITYLFHEPQNNRERTIIEELNKLEVESKFNDHRISYPKLRGLPNFPRRPGENASVQDWRTYREKTAEVAAEREAKTIDFVKSATKPVVEKWFNRDSQGNFNTDLLIKRGLFTATDADAIEAKSSVVDRREMLGEQLIDRTYLLLWEIESVKTMNEEYNSIAAANRERGITTTVNRTHEGYVLRYKAHAYKLNFCDSVAAVFWLEYWTDENNFDPEKVKLWNNITFPVEYIASVNGKIESTQHIDPDHISNVFTGKRTMDELLRSAPILMLNDAGLKFSRIIEDFKVRAPIYDIRPLAAKLGTKESLYLDQRFFIYELGLDNEGNRIKNRKGVARVKEISENDTIAIGDSDPSIFIQQGGSRLYQGMLMESKEDLGMIFNFGYSIADNNALGGVHFLINARISRALSGIVRINGLHFGIGGNINFMQNVNPGTIYSGTAENYSTLFDGTGNLSGFTCSFWGNLSKEIYFTRRGNIYFNPAVGLGLSAYFFNHFQGEPISNYENYQENEFIWSAVIIPVQLGLGINLHPAVSLEFTPGLIFRTSYQTLNSNRIFQQSLPHDLVGDWNFESIDKSMRKNTFLVQLRIRI